MLLKTFLEKTAFLTENPAATVNLKPLLHGCTLFWSDAQAIDFARVGADQFFMAFAAILMRATFDADNRRKYRKVRNARERFGYDQVAFVEKFLRRADLLSKQLARQNYLTPAEVENHLAGLEFSHW